VAEVNPDLVVRDDKGEIYTVRYDVVNAMLLNEFSKGAPQGRGNKNTSFKNKVEGSRSSKLP